MSNGSRPYSNDIGRIAFSNRVDRRTTRAAKVLQPFPAVISGFHIRGGVTHDLEVTDRDTDRHPVNRAGELLAVGTVANGDLGRIDIRTVGDGTAVAASVNPHVSNFPPRFHL